MEGWTHGPLCLLIGQLAFQTRARLVNWNVAHRALWTLKFETFRKGGVRLQTLVTKREEREKKTLELFTPAAHTQHIPGEHI